MSNWLDELIREKELANAEVGSSTHDREQRAHREQVIAVQARVSELLQNTAVEGHLLDLVYRVLADHPGFPDAQLYRVGYLQGCLWSVRRGDGPDSRVRPLPELLPIQDGISFTRIEWVLEFGRPDRVSSSFVRCKGMRVEVNANGLFVNHRPVIPPTSSNTQHALVSAFRKPITWELSDPD